MGAALSSGPETSPAQVARKTIEDIRGHLDHVLADERAQSVWQASRQDPAQRYAGPLGPGLGQSLSPRSAYDLAGPPSARDTEAMVVLLRRLVETAHD
jgi:hypothetical protein